MKLMETRLLLGVQEVPGSNPGGPTKEIKYLQTSNPTQPPQLGPNWVQTPNSLATVGVVSMGSLHFVLLSRDGDNIEFSLYMQNHGDAYHAHLP